ALLRDPGTVGVGGAPCRLQARGYESGAPAAFGEPHDAPAVAATDDRPRERPRCAHVVDALSRQAEPRRDTVRPTIDPTHGAASVAVLDARDPEPAVRGRDPDRVRVRRR